MKGTLLTFTIHCGFGHDPRKIACKTFVIIRLVLVDTTPNISKPYIQKLYSFFLYKVYAYVYTEIFLPHSNWIKSVLCKQKSVYVSISVFFFLGIGSRGWKFIHGDSHQSLIQKNMWYALAWESMTLFNALMQNWYLYMHRIQAAEWLI